MRSIYKTVVAKILLIALSTFWLMACSTEPLAVDKPVESKVQHVTKKLELALNQAVNWQDVTIEFMQLTDDSRCPRGSECFWAGNAQVILLVTTKTSAQTVSLNTHGGKEHPKSARVNGYQLALEGVSPYPAINIKIDPNKYIANLLVTKKQAQNIDKIIIDVRSDKEFKGGHYPNAIHLDYKTIESTIDSLNLDKDAEIYVYCRSGRRSGIAKEILEKKGYTRVINGINLKSLESRFKSNSASIKQRI